MKTEELFKELQFLAGKSALKNAVETRASSRPSAALTEDELCRQAILRVGTAEQFGPSSQAMLLAKSLYPQVRDALLLTGSWTWAMKSTTVIETIPRPEYKWAYRYAIPSDCLRVFRVNDWDAATGDSAWEVSGNYILTNADSGSPAWTVDRVYEVGNAVSNNGAVYKCMVAGTTKQPGVTSGWQSDWDIWLGAAITLEYVRKVTDVTLFDSLFIDLLTANLAAKLAVPLTGDANKAALLVKETEGLFKSPAMRRDSTERKPKIKPAWMSSKLVSSRNGGEGIDTAKATGGGPAGGVSYPSLQVTVGSVTALPSGTTPTVTNTGQYDTAVLNFGLPQGPVGPANTLSVGSVTTGAAGSSAGATITGTAPNQTLNLAIPKGDKGDAATVAVGSVTTLAAGTNATVANAGTTAAAVLNFGIPQGPAGTISVGSVATGAAGTSASITNTGTASNATLNFTIPKGDKGDAATVAVGSVTTGAEGSSASVTNSGNSGAAVFNFSIPRGNTGSVGPTGPANSLSIGTVDSGASAAATITGAAPSQTLNLTLPKGDQGNVGPTGPTGPLAIIQSATPPASPVSGQAWFDTDNLRTYIWYDNAWVEAVSGYAGEIVGNIDGGSASSTYGGNTNVDGGTA